VRGSKSSCRGWRNAVDFHALRYQPELPCAPTAERVCRARHASEVDSLVGHIIRELDTGHGWPRELPTKPALMLDGDPSKLDASPCCLGAG
jgi:hypothetical protein